MSQTETTIASGSQAEYRTSDIEAWLNADGKLGGGWLFR